MLQNKNANAQKNGNKKKIRDCKQSLKNMGIKETLH